jgi:hypothetical protein
VAGATMTVPTHPALTGDQMSDAVCPSCRTPLAPNARYCHACGRAVDGSRPSDDWALPSPPGPPLPPRTEVDIALFTAMKLGFGFAMGAALVGVVLAILWWVGLALALGGIRFAGG